MASGFLGIALGSLFSLGKTFAPESTDFLFSYAYGSNYLLRIAIRYLIPGAVGLYLIYMHRVRDPILAFYIGMASIALFQWFGLLNLTY